MSEHHITRANLALLQIKRLNHEAKECTDLQRLQNIEIEMGVVYGSILKIREEQLMEQLESPKRPWWKLW